MSTTLDIIMIWSMEALGILLVVGYLYKVFFARPLKADKQMSIITHILCLILLIAVISQLTLIWYPEIPERFRLLIAYTILMIMLIAQNLAQLSLGQCSRFKKIFSTGMLIVLIMAYAALILITILNM